MTTPREPKILDFDLETPLVQLYGDALAQEIRYSIGRPSDREVFADRPTNSVVFIHETSNIVNSVHRATSRIRTDDFEYGKPVLVKNTKQGYVIVGIDDQLIQAYNTNRPSLPRNPVLIDDLHYAGVALPTGVASMKVVIKPFSYVRNGTWEKVKESLSVDFSDSPNDSSAAAIDPPTTPNKAIWVLTQYDTVNNQFSYVQSSEYSATLNPLDNLSKIPQPDTGCIPLHVITLHNGITAITQNQIFNLPPFFWLSTLAGLPDVDTSGITNGQGLVWNSSSMLFEAGAVGSSVASLDDVGDVNVPSPNDNDLLTWDNGNSRWEAKSAGASGAVDAADVTYASNPSVGDNFLGSVSTAQGALDAVLDAQWEQFTASATGATQNTTTPTSYMTLRYTTVNLNEQAMLDIGTDDEIFTVPIDGFYRCYANIPITNNTTDSYVNAEFTLNGSTVARGYDQDFVFAGFDKYWRIHHDFYGLSADDEISVRLYNFSSTDLDAECEVSVDLVTAT